MSRIGRTLKGYVFWTYARGSFHYDVMVTLILAFIFIAPHYIDFKDKPSIPERHPTGIVASADGKTYQVDASAVDAQDEGGRKGKRLNSSNAHLPYDVCCLFIK